MALCVFFSITVAGTAADTVVIVVAVECSSLNVLIRWLLSRLMCLCDTNGSAHGCR